MKVLVKKLIVFKNPNLRSFHSLHTRRYCILLLGILMQSTSACTIRIICYLHLGIRCCLFSGVFFPTKILSSLYRLSHPLYISLTHFTLLVQIT